MIGIVFSVSFHSLPLLCFPRWTLIYQSASARHHASCHLASGVIVGFTLTMVVQAEPPLQTFLQWLQEATLGLSPDGNHAVCCSDYDGGSQPETKQTHVEAELRELQGKRQNPGESSGHSTTGCFSYVGSQSTTITVHAVWAAFSVAYHHQSPNGERLLSGLKVLEFLIGNWLLCHFHPVTVVLPLHISTRFHRKEE